jgi:DNA-binding transcriptional ArsR family regulator
MRVKHFNLVFGAQFFKALADEARIRILYLLYKNKELTISDIELILEFTQTKTARHLTYLKNSGLVSSKKRDQWVFYYLKDEVYDILNQVLPYLHKDPVLIADEQVLETLNSNRELAINKLNQKKWRD